MQTTQHESKKQNSEESLNRLERSKQILSKIVTYTSIKVNKEDESISMCKICQKLIASKFSLCEICSVNYCKKHRVAHECSKLASSSFLLKNQLNMNKNLFLNKLKQSKIKAGAK